MQHDIGKISARQSILIFMTIIISPAIRIIPTFSANQAKQAAWASPVFALIPSILLILMLNTIYKKYKEQSIMEIFYDILGIPLGKLIISLYFFWIILLNALYIRYFAERLVSSAFPHINIILFIITMLIVIAYILRTGITALARMNEIILPIVLFMFTLLVLFLAFQVRMDYILPVYFDDTIPVLKASTVTIGLFSYLILIPFIWDKINDKENYMKLSLQSIFLLTILLALIVFTCIGIFGSSVVSRLSIPFIALAKQIEILDTISKTESIIVTMWIFTDLILISMFIYIGLNIVKSLLNLSTTRYLNNIYIIFLFILSLGIANTRFELEALSLSIFLPTNIIFGFVIPFLLFMVGKIRRKI